jgi:hypothetical protein
MLMKLIETDTTLNNTIYTNPPLSLNGRTFSCKFIRTAPWEEAQFMQQNITCGRRGKRQGLLNTTRGDI